LVEKIHDEYNLLSYIKDDYSSTKKGLEAYEKAFKEEHTQGDNRVKAHIINIPTCTVCGTLWVDCEIKLTVGGVLLKTKIGRVVYDEKSLLKLI